jgi:hypothetical protein
MQFGFMGYYTGLVQRHPHNRFLVKSQFHTAFNFKNIKNYNNNDQVKEEK